MSDLYRTLLNLACAKLERRRRLFAAAQAIAPWVSASLTDLEPGHTGQYEKVAEEFLEAVLASEQDT